WISPFTYNAIFQSITNSWGAAPPAAPGPARKILFVRGIVDTTADTGALLPFWSVETTSTNDPGTPATGTFALLLYNGSGGLIQETFFDPQQFIIEEGDPTESLAGLFSVPIPDDPAIHQIQLWDTVGNVMLASATASPNVPVVSLVTLTATNGGSFTG